MKWRSHVYSHPLRIACLYPADQRTGTIAPCLRGGYPKTAVRFSENPVTP